MKSFLRQIFLVPFLLFGLILCLIIPKKKNTLIWGPMPILTNKYWSHAMAKAGWTSRTLMRNYYSINKREDYDLYFEDLVPGWIRVPSIKRALAPVFALLYIIHNANVVHLPFQGGPLGATSLWWIEGHLFRWAGIRTVVIPYGADAYVYSQVIDPCLRHGLLLSYPNAAKDEQKISRRVNYWSRHADIVITGYMLDGLGRWDVLVPNPFCIDLEQWKVKTRYSSNDGRNGPVYVMHTPNHRGFKGTEFLVQSIKELQAEGLDVQLTLLEGVPNDKIQEVMQHMDILAEQFIATAYALSGIEGMASGLPVMANLEHEAYTRVFRRYTFLNECPIVSTTPETIKENLRVLVTNPQLRRELGQASRQYVEKYHSYETAQYLFGSIYEKILEKKEVDLMNLFHPLKSEYSTARPLIKHPLCENHFSSRSVISSSSAQVTTSTLSEKNT